MTYQAKPDAAQLVSDLTAAASELDLLGTSIEDFNPTFANQVRPTADRIVPLGSVEGV